jgi:hypothetical protein
MGGIWHDKRKFLINFLSQSPISPVAVPPKAKILFLAANPQDTNALRLAEELRELQECLRGAFVGAVFG